MKAMKTTLAIVLGLLCAASAAGQATVREAPDPKYQFSDANGDPLPGGKLCTYITGTSTPEPTYTDHTGMVQNPNPVVLDSAGRAQVWWNVDKVYRAVLREAGDSPLECTTGTVQWTVDGVTAAGGLLTAGDLPPLFTTDVTGGTLTFTLDNVAAHKFYGNNTGSTTTPSFGGIGSDGQVPYNVGGDTEVGSARLLWDYANFDLDISNATNDGFTTVGPGCISFASGGNPLTPPVICALFNGLDLVSGANQDIHIGQSGNNSHLFLPGNDFGQAALGAGASRGMVYLNDGSSLAGSFAGLQVLAGFIATPETFVSAPTGSLFLTTMGGAMTTLWVKESSPTASTGWVAK